MAFVSNTKVGRSAMLASLDETEPCECLETLNTWKQNRNSAMQLREPVIYVLAEFVR